MHNSPPANLYYESQGLMTEKNNLQNDKKENRSRKPDEKYIMLFFYIKS